MPNCSRKFNDRYNHMTGYATRHVSPDTHFNSPFLRPNWRNNYPTPDSEKHPTQAPMRPTKVQVCFSACVETLLVLALIAVTVAVAIVIMMPL